jgi:hypothetical protein
VKRLTVLVVFVVFATLGQATHALATSGYPNVQKYLLRLLGPNMTCLITEPSPRNPQGYPEADENCGMNVIGGPNPGTAPISSSLNANSRIGPSELRQTAMTARADQFKL